MFFFLRSAVTPQLQRRRLNRKWNIVAFIAKIHYWKYNLHFLQSEKILNPSYSTALIHQNNTAIRTRRGSASVYLLIGSFNWEGRMNHPSIPFFLIRRMVN